MSTNRKQTHFIVVGGTETPPQLDIGLPQVREWDLNRGHSEVGAHYVIRRTGEVEVGRNRRKPSGGVHGYNHCSLLIVLVGGRAARDPREAEDNYTIKQLVSLRRLLVELLGEFPEAAIRGLGDLLHREGNPGFDIENWVRYGAPTLLGKEQT